MWGELCVKCVRPESKFLENVYLNTRKLSRGKDESQRIKYWVRRTATYTPKERGTDRVASRNHIQSNFSFWVPITTNFCAGEDTVTDTFPVTSTSWYPRQISRSNTPGETRLDDRPEGILFPLSRWRVSLAYDPPPSFVWQICPSSVEWDQGERIK